MIYWRPMSESPPRDKILFVEYDHDADPYVENEATGQLTIYGGWAEGGEYLPGRGYSLAYYGGGYDEDDHWRTIHMPDWWFTTKDFEVVLNPIRWMLLDEIIEAGNAE